MSRLFFDPRGALFGAAAGFAATAPMTALMLAGHRELPPREQYPLPPSEIVEDLSTRAAGRPLPREVHPPIALAAHFGYGAAMGSIYGLLSGLSPVARMATGVGFGLFTWAFSYLGLLPALKILKPAVEHPARRTGLMIAAHVVWGAALGAVFTWIDRRR